MSRFTWVNVGNRRKNSGECCSGICEGKEGKKRRRGHVIGGRRPGDGLCNQAAVPCATSTGEDGDCATTTCNGGFCEDGGGSEVCTRDGDCGGARAACIVYSSCHVGTACDFAYNHASASGHRRDHIPVPHGRGGSG